LIVLNYLVAVRTIPSAVTSNRKSNLIKSYLKLINMPTIVHFEIPSDDIERSKNFYNELFGWNFENWSRPEPLPEGHEYLIISTTDDKGNKSIGGGMMKRQNSQQQGMTKNIDVKSIQEYSAKLEQLGGKVMAPKKPVPGMGYFAVCLDTENNSFGIWETDANAS
jgi:predicted enzyme related to lactoylglutathione lyase